MAELPYLRAKMISESTNALRLSATVIAVCLALNAWLSPNHYYPWPSFHGQLSAALALAVAAVLVLTRRGVPDQRWPWSAIAALAVAAIPWLQYAGGLIFFGGDAWLVSAYLCGLAVAVVIGRRAAQDDGLEQMLTLGSWLVLAGALGSMWLALYQWFQLDYLGVASIGMPTSWTRIYGNVAQPNNFALALSWGLIAAAYLYERGRVGGVTTLLLTTFLALGVIMAQSRMVTLICLVLAAWFWYAYRRGLLGRVTPRRVAGTLLCAAAMYFVWPALLAIRVELTGASDARGIETMVSAGLRPLHWAAMIDAIGRSPWLGYGWNQVVVAQYLVAPDHPTTTEMLGDSHNLLLDLLVHNGVLVGGVIAGALLFWLVKRVMVARTTAQVFALAPILAVALHSAVEFPLNYTYFLLPVGLLAGALEAQGDSTSAVALPRWFTPTLVGAVTALCLVMTLDYLHAEEDLRRLRLEQQRIGKPMPRTFASEAQVLTQLAAFFRFADLERSRDDLSASELEWRRKAALRYPNWSVLSIYAGDLARNGHAAEAAAVLSRICRTQKPDECKLAQVRWDIMSKEDDRVAQVAFPGPSLE